MDGIPIGWYLDARDNYRCYCKVFFTDDISEIASHILTDGYCKSGIKCIRDVVPKLFVCKCGKEFTSSNYAFVHVDERHGCMTKTLSFCHKCNLQLESVAALKRHCETKRHKEFEIIEPLECKSCGVRCRGQKEIQKHLQSAKHAQRTEEGTLPLTCDVCNITCKGQKQMKAHLETNKHRKRCSMWKWI